jgi:hypothetical protein
MVALSREAGFTYGAGLQTLAGIISQGVDDAKVRGVPMTLQAGWAYDAAAAMASDKGSFINQTAHKFQCMMEAAVYRLELQYIHGSRGIAVTDAAQDSVAAVTAGDNGNNYAILPIDPLYYAAANFAGSEGALISFILNSDNSTASAAAGVGNVVNKFEIIAVDTDSKTITVKCYDANAAAALVVEIETAAYNVYFYGAAGNEMVGLRAISSNIASGSSSLYGIDASSYSVWRGNSYAVGTANLTLEKIYLGLAKAVGRGLLEDVVILVSPMSFATMANDEAALRQYNSKIMSADRGVEAIKFVGPNGSVEVLPHPMCFESQAIAFPIKKAERIGASDLTFKRPGGSEEMIQEMATQTGFECRLYSDQAIFLPDPAKCVLFTGISNASS